MNTSQTIAFHGLLQSISDGDQNAVARAGISAINADSIMNLQARELLALVQANSSFIQFKIDNDVLGLILKEIEYSRTQLKTAQEMIALDASLDMIRHFYPQIQRTQYGLQRRLSGLLTAPQGRPRSPDEELELEISTAWFHQVKDQNDPTPEEYLAVHRTASAPIRQIWAMYKPTNYGERK